MRSIWLLCAKDLRIYLRDRAALAMSLAVPIVLVLIFGGAMGAMGGEDTIGRVDLLVQDMDRGAAAREIVAGLSASKGLKVLEREDARERVAAGKAPAALLIESGYSRGTGGLRLLRDPGQEIEQQIILANLAPALFEAQGQTFAKQLTLASLDFFGVPASLRAEAREVIEDTWMRMAAIAMRSALQQDADARPRVAHVGEEPDSKLANDANAGRGSSGSSAEADSFDFARDVPRLLGLEVEDVAGHKGADNKMASQAHAVAGIAVMMLLFGLSACGGTLLEERAEGTLERVLAAPRTADAILYAKLLYTLIAGLLQLLVLFTFGALVFQLPVWSAPVALGAASFCVAFAATGFGVLLAVVCRTRKQLEGLSVLIILTMSALGGSWFPLAIVPEWFRKIGHFTLNAWAMDAYQGIFWYRKDLGGIGLELAVLLGIGIVTIGLSIGLWRRQSRNGG
jgi:ABC-2 type transport system permease protein